MKGYDNLMASMKDAGGRKKAFKMKPIELNKTKKDLILEYLKTEKNNSFNWLAVTDVEASNIIRGRNSLVDCVKVVLRMGNTGMMHHFTIDEFNSIVNK